MFTFDLSRFTIAQKQHYHHAFEEISHGKKTSHWMWFIFPQLKGLGKSSTAEYYAITSLDEAQAFLNDSYLGTNLREICQALLKLETNDSLTIFGTTDNKKLKSSMTLFNIAGENESIFQSVLEKFFGGKQDYNTLRLLGLTD